MTNAFCDNMHNILFDFPVPRAGRGSADAKDRRESTATRAATERATCTLGRCLRSCDPLGTGRVLVAYQDGLGEECHLWLAPLIGLAIEIDDELLLLEPRGAREPIIAGIVSRARGNRRGAPSSIVLGQEEALTITASNGAPLVEISQNEHGPLVRLCDENVQWEMPGKLRIAADDIELCARDGEVSIEAFDDVVIRGETIRLN